MWEWRLFFHGDLREAFVRFAETTLKNMEPHGPPENRTDVYVSCSDVVGAKARGGGFADGQIEVKVRTDRKKRGAEMWSKTRTQRPSAAEGAENSNAPGSVLKDVKLVVSASDWNESTAMEVVAFKSRTMFKVHEDRFKGIHMECTLVRVDPEGKAFTSICLEHKKDPKVIYSVIEAMNLEAFHPQQRLASSYQSADVDDEYPWMNSSVVGYPEFAMFVARSRIASATSSGPNPPELEGDQPRDR